MISTEKSTDYLELRKVSDSSYLGVDELDWPWKDNIWVNSAPTTDFKWEYRLGKIYSQSLIEIYCDLK